MQGDVDVDVAEIADRLALRELVDRYAAAVDARDAEAFAALFGADGELVVVRAGHDSSTRRGPEELGEITRLLARYGSTLHLVANHLVELDGDRATGVALCQAHHLVDLDEVQRDLVLTIRYHDTYARTGPGWTFARREVHIQWSSTHLVEP